MRIKTTQGLRNIRYRSLHQQTRHSEVITHNAANSETPHSSSQISEYAPVIDRQSTSRPSYFSHHLKAPLQHPLPARPKSAISNSSTIRNTTFSDSEFLPARRSDSPRANSQEGESIHWVDSVSSSLKENPPTMSSIDRIVTQIDSLLRGSDLNRPTQFSTQSALAGHRDYHSPLVSEQTRVQDVLSRSHVDGLLQDSHTRHLAETRQLTEALSQARDQVVASRNSAGQIEQLTTELRAKDALLFEARKTLSSASSESRASNMELERLSLLLREAERSGEDEKKKRQEAESKERAAVAQQSSLAKSKHELDLQVAVLKREVEEERRKRAVSENRAIALDKRAADAENMIRRNVPPRTNEKELENLRVQNRGLVQKQVGLLDQISAAALEKQKFVDKQNTLRNENQGLRERVDQLLVNRQGENQLQKDKDGLKARIKELEEDLKKVNKETRAWQRRVDDMDRSRRKLKEELAETRTQAVLQRDDRQAKEGALGRRIVSRNADKGLSADYRGSPPGPSTHAYPPGLLPPQLQHPVPIPRSLADIPSLVAQSENGPTSVMNDGDNGLPRDFSSKHISRDTTPTRRVSHHSSFETRAETDIRPSPSTLHNTFMPLRPVDPYANLGVAFGVQRDNDLPASVEQSQSPRFHETTFDGLHAPVSVVQPTAMDNAPSYSIQEREKDDSLWNKLYDRVTAAV